jgi:hypothetical protein
MAKAYRPVLRDQVFLPPDMREWLPEDHLVWFLLETIDVLDTSEFDRYRRLGGVGAAGYDPRMLLGLWKYPALADTYCEGTRSSLGRSPLCLVLIHLSSVDVRSSWPGCRPVRAGGSERLSQRS